MTLIVVGEITLGAFVTGALLEVPTRLLRAVLVDHLLQSLLHFGRKVMHIIRVELISSTAESFRIATTIVHFSSVCVTPCMAEVAGVAELAHARPEKVPAWRVFRRLISEGIAGASCWRPG